MTGGPDGWVLHQAAPGGSIFTHGWQLMMAPGWSTGGEVGHGPSFQQPGLPLNTVALEGPTCLNGCARLRRQVPEHAAEQSCVTFYRLHGEVRGLLLPRSTGFNGVTGPSRFQGRKKGQKTRTPSFNGRRVQDYYGHHFKPPKDRSDNVEGPPRATLLRQSIFYYHRIF